MPRGLGQLFSIGIFVPRKEVPSQQQAAATFVGDSSLSIAASQIVGFRSPIRIWLQLSGVAAAAGVHQGAATFAATSALRTRTLYKRVLFAPGANYIPQTDGNGFDTFWNHAFSTITENVGVAPDSTTTAARVVPDTSSGRHAIFNGQNFGSRPAEQFTYSCYCKAAGYNFAQLSGTSGTDTFTIIVDLTNGTITNSLNQFGVGLSSSVSNEGGGWYRLRVTVDHQSSVIQINVGAVPTGTPTYDQYANATFTGNGTDGILIWHPQGEPGPDLSGFVPTTTTTPVWDQILWSGASSLRARFSFTHDAAATFAGAGSLAVDTAKSKLAAATFAGAGSLSALGGLQQAAAATFQGAGTFSAFATITGAITAWSGEARLNATGNLSAATLQQQQALATLQGAGGLSVAANLQQAIAVSYAGAGALSAVARLALPATAALAGAGNLSALALASMRIAATFQGAGTLSAFATITGAVNAWSGEARFTGVGSLSIATLQQMAAVARFAGAGALVADATKSVGQAVVIFAGSSTLAVGTTRSLAATARFAANSNFSADTQYRQAHPGLATLSGAGTFSANVLHFHAHQAQVQMDGAGALSIATRQTQNIRAIFGGRGIIEVYLTSSSDLLPIIPVPVPGGGAQPRPDGTPAVDRCAGAPATARDTRTTRPAVKRAA